MSRKVDECKTMAAGAGAEGGKGTASAAVGVASAIAMRGRGVSLGGDAGKDEAGGLSTHTPVGHGIPDCFEK